MIIPILVLCGVILLVTALLALPFLLESSGALTAFVRPDLVVIFHSRASGRHGPFDSIVMATRTHVFLIPHRRIGELTQFVWWVANGNPWEATSSRPALVAWTAEGLEDAFRQRLSDPGLTAMAIEQMGVACLPGESALALATLGSYRVETRAPRGFWFQPPGATAPVRVPIHSEADALALQRLLA